MAATITEKKRTKLLGLNVVVAKITMDNSYPTGGLEILPAKFGLQSIDVVIPTNAAGYMFEYDNATSKLKAYTVPSAEVVALTNLSAVSCKVIVIGL